MCNTNGPHTFAGLWTTTSCFNCVVLLRLNCSGAVGVPRRSRKLQRRRELGGESRSVIDERIAPGESALAAEEPTSPDFSAACLSGRGVH